MCLTSLLVIFGNYHKYHMMVNYVNTLLTLSSELASVPLMARLPAEDKGAWNFREIPRGLMQRVKMAAAYEGKTVKQWLMDLARVRLGEMEKRGILPKGK